MKVKLAPRRSAAAAPDEGAAAARPLREDAAENVSGADRESRGPEGTKVPLELGRNLVWESPILLMVRREAVGKREEGALAIALAQDHTEARKEEGRKRESERKPSCCSNGMHQATRGALGGGWWVECWQAQRAGK